MANSGGIAETSELLYFTLTSQPFLALLTVILF
jgi:hypothetical protein